MDEQTALTIQALLKHPAWKLLEEEIGNAHQRYLKTLTARIDSGTVLDQRELDYMRGRFDGAKLLLRQPGRAIQTRDKLEKEREQVV